jgi:hypothetical protein
MRSRGTRTLPARLEAARRRFERWRRTREGGSRIPDPLWNSAVKLSATYGIHRTAKTLRLNPDSLKKHVASASGKGSGRLGKSRPQTAGREAATAFIELLPLERSMAPECIVELENPCGAKMRFQVTGGQTLNVVTAVSKVLLGAG